MRAKVVFSTLLGVVVIAFLLIWFLDRGFAVLKAEAHQPPVPDQLPQDPPPQALQGQGGQDVIEAADKGTTKKAPQAGTGDRRILSFRTAITPFFEGGSQGQPIPFTVEVRSDSPFDDDLLKQVAAELPEKVKEQLHSALMRQIRLRRSGASVEDRLDTILERLERMERRLKAIEKKSPVMPPVERKKADR